MRPCQREGCALPACWRVTYAGHLGGELQVCNRHLLDFEEEIERREVRFDDLDADHVAAGKRGDL
jgi:hypothetical protein